MDTLITNGFIQLISKATRMQNNNNSLIDHIITNTNHHKYNAGTIIDDLSDHFMNFIQITQDKMPKNNLKPSTKRHINETNLINLRNALRNTDWQPVFALNNVDDSFNKFWDIFDALYTEHFPEINIKFNKNKHKIHGYMNNDLLNERLLKLNLHKKYLISRTLTDHDAYISQRNKYNTLLRQSKQSYYTENLIQNVKNPKRTWQLLKEAANLSKPNSSVEQIEKNVTLLTDPTDIASEFNEFFTGIGV
jgi:hypothetical protein